MSDPKEAGIDLSTQQDAGFSLGSITRRDGGRVLSPDQQAEAAIEAGRIAGFAQAKGLNFATKEVSPLHERDIYVTTFVLSEKRVTGEYELTVNITDTRKHKTSDGRTSRTAELSISPSKPPFFYIAEETHGGVTNYGYEASAAELRSVLGSLQRGAFDNYRGSTANPEVPSWRSLAPQS